MAWIGRSMQAMAVDPKHARSARSAAALIAVTSIAGPLTACSISSSDPCFWRVYETTEQTVEDSELVVSGTISGVNSERVISDAVANVWKVNITDWQKGESSQQIEVASTPEGCRPGDVPYPRGGDPLEQHSGGSVTLFLISEGDEWRTITPWQAVLPSSANDAMPKFWPELDGLKP